MNRWQATWLVAVLGAATVPPSGAVVRRVPSDYPTILAAMDAAVSGDSVLVAPGVYSDIHTRLSPYGDPETASVFLKGGVVLVSEAGAAVTVIDQQGQIGPNVTNVVDGWFQAEPMWIEGFTITGGAVGSSGIEVGESSKLTVKDCVLRDLDDGSGNGGGVGSLAEDLDILGCRFESCRAYLGGAVWQFAANLRIEDCVFEACGDGAVKTYWDNSVPGAFRAEVRRSEFYANTESGIGIGSYHGGILIEDCVFVDNTHPTAGGAVGGSSLDEITVRNCIFVNNSANTGGAVTLSGRVMIEGCTFYGNHHNSLSFPGSAMRLAIGPSIVRNCVIAGGYGGPGAVRISNGTVTSECNVFWENEGGVGHLVPGPTDREADPLFCDPVAGDFTVAENSPCLPAYSGGCDLIGVYGIGCDEVSVDPTSWTRTKALFRR